MTTESASVVEQAEEDSRSAFQQSLLSEACLAVAGDMECYDYQIGRLIRKVDQALADHPGWGISRSQLLNLVRCAAAGFGGRRETVWLASFESSLEPEVAQELVGRH
jgi:hypothetical protein